MKREILFRGKRADNGEWVYGHYFTEIGRGVAGSNDTIVYFIKDKFGTHPVIPETVGQFTGLTDKNGVKIFEGDIMAGDGEDVPNRKVEWSNNYLGYFVGLGQDVWQSPLYDVILPEVIGDIHDDLSLLNSDKEDYNEV
jgi:hypothetical protein